jgi:hypothetical protein
MTLNELANKWGTDKGDGNYDRHDYAKIYEEFIEMIPERNRSFRLLEIGVWDPRNPGASIRMWREFLPDAEIFGADINVECISLEKECNVKIFIADQSLQSDLEKMMKEIGEIDFVVDDGSHNLAHQITSLQAIWPYLVPGGFYAIEDLHAPQSQPKEKIVEEANALGIKNGMWMSPKLLIFRKE